jgi:hypothetical protein
MRIEDYDLRTVVDAKNRPKRRTVEEVEEEKREHPSRSASRQEESEARRLVNSNQDATDQLARKRK